MPDNVFLGPKDSETTLPNVKFIGGIPSWPVSNKKQAKKVKMSDGSYRWAFFDTLKVFQIKFGYLTIEQLGILDDLNELNQVLRYKNEHEEDVWYHVVITNFTHDPERMDMRQLDKYRVSMTLEETNAALRDT